MCLHIEILIYIYVFCSLLFFPFTMNLLPFDPMQINRACGFSTLDGLKVFIFVVQLSWYLLINLYLTNKMSFNFGSRSTENLSIYNKNRFFCVRWLHKWFSCSYEKTMGRTWRKREREMESLKLFLSFNLAIVFYTMKFNEVAHLYLTFTTPTNLYTHWI